MTELPTIRPGDAPDVIAGSSSRPGPRPGGARRFVTGIACPAGALALTLLALLTGHPLTDLQRVGAGLLLAAVVSAAVLARSAERTPQWQVAAGTLAGSAAFACYRLPLNATGSAHDAAIAGSTGATLITIAISVHLVLALPDGRLTRPPIAVLTPAQPGRPAQPSRPRRIATILAYAAAIAAGLALGIRNLALSVPAGAVVWAAALALALPALRLRYRAAAGRDRERLQWIGAGAVLAAGLALAAGVLHLLVGWPAPVAATAAACTVLLPAGMIAGEIRPLGPAAGRFLVELIAVAGFTVLVAVVYVIVVLGVGRGPADASDRELLGLSMLAAAIAAIGYLPARERLLAWAKHAVYGAREAPDEALRTFGSRLSRAIPMDELLLQLAESLRKTMKLTSAEVYTGSGDILERAVSVPDSGPRNIVVTPRERAVVTRAGVSGSAWATVWLPALVDGRETAQLRVAPVSHAGQLLGLIVIERPVGSDSFTDEDDRVLTDLARQVGLAFHNAQLDSALQNTLDELRAQADALRESRARIVASGDAERRRLERNLHDGAQQNLVALAVNLRLARDMLDEPLAAGQMLDQLAEDLKVTIADLRDLAHGIYPPLLADSGLGRALEAAASRSPLAVTVLAPGARRYSADIEAAVYFCCLEALQNAVKHAPGADVEVRVWEESGGLLFAVRDDGPGFDTARAHLGHGYTNMADRLGAIGGTVRWQSEPGHGTTVQGSIPLT
ncbi:MAG TPA: histidine kinase [Streptosporangiaceae bacterium]|nr:histidine kinase [Streptosporangiaceae bacterium]